MEGLNHIRYRYPALTEAELELEVRLRELEEETKVRCSESRRFFGKQKASSVPCEDTLCFEEPMSSPCGAAYSDTAEEYESDCDFEAERARMLREVRERIEKLRMLGVDELELRKLFEKEDTLSRLVVTRDYRILLPDYHDMEIEMNPLPKALFLLYLRHEEGISFKYLTDYEGELREIYLRLTDRVQPEVIDKSIQSLCDPTQNAINEKCTRIREAFVNKFDVRLAQHYFITGKRGEVKRIQLQRDLVTWEQ